MNKKKATLLLLVSIFITSKIMSAPSHVLTFFIEPYPIIKDTLENNENAVTHRRNYNKGVFVTYFGYRTVSDNNGQVTFPLKTQDPRFYLLVSNAIKPVFMLYNTIHHWEVSENTLYSFFSITRKYDEKSRLYFWSVEQLELPSDLEIPLNTIVIHASPESIFVPTGISLTTDSSQLLLPAVYVLSEFNLARNALEFLDNCEFFAPIERSFKADKASKESKL